MANQREASKQNWTSSDTIEDINSGCLQRIADATELIAKNYTQLLKDIESHKADADKYKRLFLEQLEVRSKIYKRISAYQGVITKQKKLIAQLKSNNPQQNP